MKKKKGFTLIELLSVIVIIAIVLAIAIPRISNYEKDRKKDLFFSVAKNILREIEYENIGSEESLSSILSSSKIDVSSNQIDIDKSKVYRDIDGEITINLFGKGSYDGLYLCNVKTSSKKANYEDNICLPHKISVDFNPMGGVINLTKKEVSVGETYGELPIPVKENYAFIGWFYNNEKIEETTRVECDINHVLIAKYKYNTKLTVDLDDGTTTQTFNERYQEGETIALVAPVKTNYTFTGWKIVSGNAIMSGNSLTFGSNDVVIKALYKSNTTSITLNLDGGTISTDVSGQYTIGQTITLETPTKTGYDFSKWQITIGNSTLSGNKLTIGTTDTTIKAIYTAKKYTVTYNANGGTVNTSSRIVTYDNTYGTLVTPKRLGYSFLGWYTAKTGGSKISSNTIVKITSNQTIYAHWQLEYLLCNNSVIKCGVAESDLKSTSITQFLRYTGTCEYICDDASSGNFRIKFKTSGKLLSTETTKIDAFLVGGGGGGADSDRITDLTQYGGDTYRHGGAGGGGGYTTTKKNITLTKNTTYTITIGAGGLKADDKKAGDGKTTSAFGANALGGKGGNVGSESNGAGIGGDGGSGGGNYSFYTPSPGGSDGANSGGKGQGTTTAEFGETGRTLYSGGGAGGRESFNWYCKDAAASEGGGGGTGENGTANTGGGGGGGRGGNSGGNGGSGIVVIRNIVPEPKDKVTFSKMLNNYKCSYSSGSTTGLYFTYTGKCSLLNDSGTHYKVVFTTSGTLKIYSSLPIDAFLVAGGGGGSGNSYGYGGNGGEVVTEKGITLTAGSSYSIVIGAGGAGGDYLSRGSNGSNTTAFGITAHGGLGGGNTSNSYGSAGGTPSSDNCTPAKGKSYGIGGQYKNSNSQTTCEFNEAIFNSSGTITGCKAKAYGPGGGAKCTSETNCGYNNCGSAGGVDGGGYGAGYLDNYHQGGGSATANTGGGGGAGSNVQGNEGGGGSGGSGIVMIRDAR